MPQVFVYNLHGLLKLGGVDPLTGGVDCMLSHAGLSYLATLRKRLQSATTLRCVRATHLRHLSETIQRGGIGQLRRDVIVSSITECLPSLVECVSS